MNKQWIEESKNRIWRNTKDKTLTVECHKDIWESNDEEPEHEFFYVFPARNGKGLIGSPYIYRVINRSLKSAQRDALIKVKELMEEYKQ